MSRAPYDQLQPAIYPIPEHGVPASTALSAITPGLTAGLVGTVGPVTAQELSQLGSPYNAQSVIGQTGLEQAAERRLAGRPGATITVASAGGANIATLATLPAHPGTPVTTTINPSIQQAAEAALSVKRTAPRWSRCGPPPERCSPVSVNSGGFDQAIDRAFPPGSTFKVITSTALITHGLTPRSAASCPGTATIDGEVFHNAEGDTPVNNLLQAFTESCNTAFIRLATTHLARRISRRQRRCSGWVRACGSG